MTKSKTGLAVIALGLMLAGALWAQDARQNIARAKAATAYIAEPHAKAATAVCVTAEGLFLTSDAVAAKVPESGMVKLVLDPNGQRPRELQARLVGVDKELGLAILQVVDVDKPLAFLPLGDDAQLIETMGVHAFGYVHPRQRASSADYPEVYVRSTQITSLTQRAGKLTQIQIATALEAGHAGGPITDETGTLVAIVRSDGDETSVRRAVPVSQLRALLNKPLISVSPPVVAPDKRHEEFELHFAVVPILSPLGEATVEVELTTNGTERRTFRAEPRPNHQYTARIVPSQDAEDGAVWLTCSVSYANGTLSGRIRDQTVHVSEQSLQLAEIKSLRYANELVVETHAGKRLIGRPASMPVQFDLGGQKVSLDLALARKVELKPNERGEPRIELAVIVRKADQVVARHAAPLTFASLPAPSSPATTGQTEASALKQGSLTLELAGTVSDVVLAAEGRLVLVHLANNRTVAVYDVQQAKIVRYLPLDSSDARIAASKDKMIVVRSQAGIIERWSLKSFERELTKTVAPGDLKVMALGFASDGPLLLGIGTQSSSTEFSVDFHDLSLEKVLSVPAARWPVFRHSEFYVRASASGSVFGFWPTNTWPLGLNTLALTSEEIKIFSQPTTAGHVAPGDDGARIFTGTGQIRGNTLSNRDGLDTQPNLLLPTTDPRFYFSLPWADPNTTESMSRGMGGGAGAKNGKGGRGGADAKNDKAAKNSKNAKTDKNAKAGKGSRSANLGDEPPPPQRPILWTVGNNARVVEMPALPLGEPPARSIGQEPLVDKRVMYLPQASQLITVPYTNDRLSIQAFDWEAKLRADGEYLLVTSIAPRQYRSGETLHYQMEVLSRSGGVQFALDRGPPNMTVDSAGIVRWDVPPDYRTKNVEATISIRNSAGQSIVEKLTLTNSK